MLNSGAYILASLISAEYVCRRREDNLNIEFRVRKKDAQNLKVWLLRSIERRKENNRHISECGHLHRPKEKKLWGRKRKS